VEEFTKTFSSTGVWVKTPRKRFKNILIWGHFISTANTEVGRLMDFDITAEQRMVQQMVRDFVQREVAPVIKECDRKQEMASFILPRMAELGILGICIPARYGGQGMDYISLGLACEELESWIPPCGWLCLSIWVSTALGSFNGGAKNRSRSISFPRQREMPMPALG
jgi:hypothetical protein